jgi:mannan endo-1,4-beta-mannosidase
MRAPARTRLPPQPGVLPRSVALRPPVGVPLVLLIVSVALVGASARAAAPKDRSSRLSKPSRSIYWGAYIDGDETYRHLYGGGWGDAPWDASTWAKFEAHTRKAVSIVHWGSGTPWAHSFEYWRKTFDLVRSRGAINFVDMQTGSVRLRDIARGDYDAFFARWATEARAYGHPFFLRWNWEMDGGWFPWGTARRNQNTPADYVAAWRHVHDIFIGAGATNVTWVWCPNIEPFRKVLRYERLYPGDAYVDWTALDGYNQNGRESFRSLFGRSYRELARIAPSKPILIAETSSIEGGRIAKPTWISDALSRLPHEFPQVKGFLWMNWRIDERGDWRNWQIESSPSTQLAFAQAIGSPYYAPGGGLGFQNLAPLTKIQPLR